MLWSISPAVYAFVLNMLYAPLLQESLNELENIVRATGVNSLIAALPNESLESEVYCLALVNLRIAARLAKNNGELDDKTTRRVRRKENQLMRSKGCRSR